MITVNLIYAQIFCLILSRIFHYLAAQNLAVLKATLNPL